MTSPRTRSPARGAPSPLNRAPLEKRGAAVHSTGRSADKVPMLKTGRRDPLSALRAAILLRGGASVKIDEFSEAAHFESAPGNFEQIDQHARGGLCVPQGSMSRTIGDAEVGTNAIQVVAAELGDQSPRELSSTQHRSAIAGKPAQIESAGDEPVIEGSIVGDERSRRRSIEPARERPQRTSRRGRFCDHRIVNTGQCDDRARQLSGRPHQGLEAIGDPQPRNPHRPDLENRSTVDIEAGRLEIDHHKIRSCDLLIGHFEFSARSKIAGVQPIRERLRGPIQREAHNAASERWIHFGLDREQLLREFDEPHGCTALAEPIQGTPHHFGRGGCHGF